MEKIITFTVAAYLLYYLTNIAYDLFVKKSPVVRNRDDGDLIRFHHIEDGEDADHVRKAGLENAGGLSEQDLFETGENTHPPPETEPQDLEEEPMRDWEEQEDREHSPNKMLPADIENGTYGHENESLLAGYSPARTSSGTFRSEQIRKSPQISEDAFRGFFEKANSHVVRQIVDGHIVYRSSL